MLNTLPFFLESLKFKTLQLMVANDEDPEFTLEQNLLVYKTPLNITLLTPVIQWVAY